MAKPFVILKLDKEYEFRLTNKAAYYFEQVSGKTFMEIGNSFGISDMNAIIYGGLRCIDNSLSFEDVLDLVDEYADMETLSDIIQKAMEQSTFFNKAKNQKKPHPIEAKK